MSSEKNSPEMGAAQPGTANGESASSSGTAWGRWLSVLRRVGCASLLVLMLWALGGGSCYHRYDDDDCYFDDDAYNCDDDDFDDDDFDDDDDNLIVVTDEIDEPSFLLGHYQLVENPDVQRHPVLRLSEIRGVSMFALLGPGEYTDSDFAQLTQRVLIENEALLGLSVGVRKLDGVQYSANQIVVTYRQWIEQEQVAGAYTTFVFDAFGLLQQINNTVLESLPEREHSLR